jgi:hypothetical protein
VNLRSFLRKNSTRLWLGFAVIASLRLIYEAVTNSTDLHVYWRAAHLWFDGISPYLYDASDRGNVFKYPPWTLPLYFPLGWISWEVTRWVWVFAELFAIGYAIKWLDRAGVNRQINYLIAALYWWTWKGHIYSGQFTIFILLACLWAVPPEEDRKLSSGKLAFLSIVITSKVYSVFTMFGVFKEMIRPRTIIYSVASVLLLEGLVLAVLRLHGNHTDIIELHRTWVIAARSGAAELGAHVVRGQGNHSLTAGFLRWFKVDPLDSSKDGYVALLLGCIFSALWFHFSKSLQRAEQWVGWIGVGMVIHPLLWHHSFVMAFPICALALDRAIKVRDRLSIVLASLSTFFIAILIPNIFGMTIVTPFELISSKSWGVIIAGIVLVRCQFLLEANHHFNPQGKTS